MQLFVIIANIAVMSIIRNENYLSGCDLDRVDYSLLLEDYEKVNITFYKSKFIKIYEFPSFSL